jgi:translation initiation factor IF-3
LNSPKLYWRINEYISAPELRVIDADSKQIGVMSKSDALSKAREAQLDLVEIAPNAVPPVAKIVDYNKFRYQEEKKQRQEAKKTKGGEIKEIRFSPFIAEGDYQTRIARIREFLEDRNKVRIVVVFTGRQMNSKQFGYDVTRRVILEFGDAVVVDMEPKFLGRRLSTVISPNTKKGNINAKTQNKEISNQEIQN